MMDTSEPERPASPDMVDHVLRVEELCDRFEDEWHAGCGLLVEDFFRTVGLDPAAAPPDLVRELLKLEAEYRILAGKAGEPDEYTRRFPQLTGEMLSLLGRATNPGDETLFYPPGSALPTYPSIPGYEILAELGRGGMGVVYKAQQTDPWRLVALKVIRSGHHASRAELGQFRTEITAVARLQNTHVVQVFEVGEYEGLPYFSMELCTGGTLTEKLAGNPMPPRHAAELVEKLALGVRAAHEAAVVHRDLKPANVLFTADETPKVTDFGLARLTDSDAGSTETGLLLGTASYMAPEAARGEGRSVGFPADVYALGAVLYECLTGRPPFRGATNLDTLEQVKGQAPVAVRDLVPSVPRDLETICHKCLEKEPSRRYPTAALLRDDLRAFLEHRPIKARPIGQLGRLRRWARRNPSAAALVVVVIAALGAAVGFGVDKSRSYQRDLRQAEWNRYERNIRDAGDALEHARYDAAEAFLHDCPEYLRNFEWHVLRSACRPNLKLRLAHGSHVCGVAADLAEGKRIATAGMDGRVVLWDAESGQQLAVLQTFPKRVNNLTSGARGRYLAAAWDDGMSIWDVTTNPPRLVAERKVGGRVALAQDTDLVALGSGDGQVTVWCLSRSNADEPALVAKYSGTIHCLALSRDGKQLAVGGMLSNVGNPNERSGFVSLRVWDVSKQQPLDYFRADSRIGHVFGLAWGVGDQRLVTVSNQTGVVWDATEGRPAENLPGYETGPTVLAFDRAGRHLAASFANGAVKVWEFQPNPQLVFARKPDLDEGNPGFVCVSFDPKGECLAYSQRSEVFVERWKSHGGVRVLSGQCLAYSPDGTRAATGASDGSVRLRDAADGREIASTGTGHSVSAALAFSPDGASVAIGRGDSVWIWEPGSGREVRNHTLSGKVLSVTYSPSGGFLASSDNLGNIQVWDAKTGALHKALPPASGSVLSLAFSPDGRRLAAGDLEWRVSLWDTQTWASADLGGHMLGVTAVSFSPDGRWLGSSSADQTVRVWEVNPVLAEQSRESRITLPHGVGVAGVAFSADSGRGGRLVTLGHDGIVRFWALKADAERKTGGDQRAERHRELLSLNRWQKGGGTVRGVHVALRPGSDHRQVAVTFSDGHIEMRDGDAN